MAPSSVTRIHTSSQWLHITESLESCHQLFLIIEFITVIVLPDPHCSIIWVRKYRLNDLFMPYANNKGADQPAHSCSLISAFVVRCLDSTISLVSISEISSLYLASVAVQAGLSLTWSKTPKPGFLVMWLNWLRLMSQSTLLRSCQDIAVVLNSSPAVSSWC